MRLPRGSGLESLKDERGYREGRGLEERLEIGGRGAQGGLLVGQVELAWILEQGAGGGPASLNLDHAVALQADCWQQLQSGLDTRAQMFLPCLPGLHAQPCLLRCHLGLPPCLLRAGHPHTETSLFPTQGENPGG